MTTLRTQLQITRINRTKTRVQAWWHANRCPACAQVRVGIQGVLATVQEAIEMIEQEPAAKADGGVKHH